MHEFDVSFHSYHIRIKRNVDLNSRNETQSNLGYTFYGVQNYAFIFHILKCYIKFIPGST